MTRETAEELLAYCRDVVGEDLRAVTCYGRNDHVPIYTREDVREQLQLDEASQGMFRLPLVRMQNAMRRLGQLNPLFDDPDVALYSYGTIAVLQFPITEQEGIIVTLDWKDELPTDLVSRCKTIVYAPA